MQPPAVVASVARTNMFRATAAAAAGPLLNLRQVKYNNKSTASYSCTLASDRIEDRIPATVLVRSYFSCPIMVYLVKVEPVLRYQMRYPTTSIATFLVPGQETWLPER